jgi:hypothetical protein
MAVIESKEMKERVERNRRVFCSPDGQEWLSEFLVENHFLDVLGPGDTEAIVRRNVCLEILYGIGSLQDMNIDGYTEAMTARTKRKTLPGRMKELVDKFVSMKYTEGEKHGD